MRLKCELVDTKLKMVERSIFGLNTKIRRTMEVIDPTTYVDALRSAKAMEGPRVEERSELAVTIGQKRWYLLRELNGLPLACRQQQTIEIAQTKRGQEETRNHNAMHVDRCGWEGNVAKNFIIRRMENSVNPPRDLGVIVKLMQTLSPARESALTNREIKKFDRVVIGTLSLLTHYTFILFDLGSTHSFIFVRYVSQVVGL